MATINELSAIDAAAGADQLPVYDSSNGDARKMSLSVLLAYMQGNITFPEYDHTVQHEVPGTFGFDATVPSGINVHIIFTGTDNGVIRYPELANTVDKQEILVSMNGAIAALTNQAPAGGGVTIHGYPTSLSDGNFFRMKFDSQTATWYRIG